MQISRIEECTLSQLMSSSVFYVAFNILKVLESKHFEMIYKLHYQNNQWNNKWNQSEESIICTIQPVEYNWGTNIWKRHVLKKGKEEGSGSSREGGGGKDEGWNKEEAKQPCVSRIISYLH